MYGLVKTLDDGSGGKIKLAGNALTFILYKSYFGRDLLNDIVKFAKNSADAGAVQKFNSLNIRTAEDLSGLSEVEQAEILSAVSGYKLDLADGLSSYSGYKDWFINEFGKPGYTIEVGAGENPLPIEQFDGIYSDILEMLVMAETL